MKENKQHPVLILREITGSVGSFTADTFRFSPRVGENPYEEMELLRSGGGVNLGSLRVLEVKEDLVRFVVKGRYTGGEDTVCTLRPGEEKTYTHTERRALSDAEYLYKRELHVAFPAAEKVGI